MIDTDTPNERELREMDLHTLAQSSRSAWEQVKNQIPAEARKTLEPHFNVLTDQSYIQQQTEVLAGSRSS